MRKLSPFVPFVLTMGLLIAGCSSKDESGSGDPGAGSDSTMSGQSKTGGTEDAASFAINVKTMVAQPQSFDDVIEVIGTVKPSDDIMVASEEGGKVEGWMVRKGAHVKEGQTLLKLNDDLLQAQLKGAHAQQNIARVNADKSATVYADAGAVSEVSVTTAKYNLDAATANVELLETRIAKMTVKAPVSGIIEERLTDVGEMVAPGSPVARLIRTGTVKVAAGVPERYVDGIRVGLPVSMKFDALRGKDVRGKITYVGAAIDQHDRSVPVEIELSNSGQFKPEMVANLTIVRDRLSDVVVIPRTALIRVEGGYEIYVVVRDPSGNGYVAEARDVELGPSDQGNVVIKSGLQPGERIITVGQSKVNPGEHVDFEG